MHLDETTLVMIACDEHELTGSERSHLDHCHQCATELDAILGVVKTAQAGSAGQLVAPADSVWQSIHAELGLSDAVAESPQWAPHNGEEDAATASSKSDELAAGAEPETAQIIPMRRAGGSAGPSGFWPLAAAAALVVGVGGGIVGTTLLSAESDTVLAEAELEPFPTWEAVGAAQLAEGKDSRKLLVELTAPSGGIREVWLINPETSGLLSLGLLDGTTGQFSIPADIDLDAYSVVDISEEPDDGNPGHSGDSIVRGALVSG